MYTFSLPTKIIFGTDSLYRLPDLIRDEETGKFGKKVFLVTGEKSLKESGVLEDVQRIFSDSGVDSYLYDQVSGEPEVESIDQAVKVCKEEKCAVVVSIGGGSVIDTGKAVAGLVPVEDFTSVADYLEEVRPAEEKMRILDSPGLPFLACPTTAGTGAEVTMNAVIINKKLKTKRSFRSPYLFAQVALIDPILTLSLSRKITASSGIDALTHLLEGYFSPRANEVTDLFALQGIKSVMDNLYRVVIYGGNTDARIKMSSASLFGGIVLNSAGLGLGHGIASFLGCLHNVSHGVACALVLLPVLEYNWYSLPTDKIAHLINLLGENPIERIKDLLERCALPSRLSGLGIKEKDLPEIAEKSLTASSTKNNPTKISYEEVLNLLKNIF